MLKAVFFDLDGTLLPLNEQEFVGVYFKLLYEKVKYQGFEEKDLLSTIWAGTFAMYKNDGKKTNEEVFWNVFAAKYGEKVLENKKDFDDFYNNEFKLTKKACKENPLAKDIAKFAKENLQYSILSTNPIFPKCATLMRMDFTGLKESDFDYITFYEECKFAKPNPMYFKFLLEKFNLKPEEVIVFGNNDQEDYMCAKGAGLDCYLVDGNLIKHEGIPQTYKVITMDEVIPTIKKEIENRK